MGAVEDADGRGAVIPRKDDSLHRVKMDASTEQRHLLPHSPV